MDRSNQNKTKNHITRMVVFSLLRRIWGECSIIHFPPALVFIKLRLACVN